MFCVPVLGSAERSRGQPPAGRCRVLACLQPRALYPLSAARRLVGQLPNARLITFGENEGHLAGYHRQGEILDELLARG
jgi:hypothetical protein